MRAKALVIDRIVKLKDVEDLGYVLYDKDATKAYLKKPENSLDLFFTYCLNATNGSEIKVEDMYSEYVRFCRHKNMPIHTFEEFIGRFEKVINSKKFRKFAAVEYDGVVVKGIGVDVEKAVDKVISKDGDLFFFEKKGFLGRKKIVPVHLVIARAGCTHSLDNVVTYVENSENELVLADDNFLGEVVASLLAMGTRMGKQEAIERIKRDVFIVLILTIILIIIVSYLLLNQYRIQEILQKII